MTPLILIAGFLGAGKTTFLQEYLPRLCAAGKTAHVILNDFQNAHVDAVRLRDLARALLPLNGSCVCCGARDDLMNLLAELPLDDHSIVLIEANGTTDTEELLEFLTADRRAARYAAPIQVTVVDALRWQKRHWNNPLEKRQARTATHLMITRKAEVPAERLHQVEAALREINPRAVFCDASTFEPSGATQHTRQPAPHHHVNHAASVQIPLPRTLRRDALTSFLNNLPPEVIRAKGIALLDDGRAWMFQKAEGAESPSFLNLGNPQGLEPVAIFIGPHLNTEALQRGLDASVV